MEPNSPAEELPALYRLILDRVAALEALGDRVEAGRVRAAATAAYSRAWDARARRELSALLRRAERLAPADRVAPHRNRGRAVRRAGLVRPPTAPAAER